MQRILLMRRVVEKRKSSLLVPDLLEWKLPWHSPRKMMYRSSEWKHIHCTFLDFLSFTNFRIVNVSSVQKSARFYYKCTNPRELNFTCPPQSKKPNLTLQPPPASAL